MAKEILVTMGLGILGVILLSTVLTGVPYYISCFAWGLVAPSLSEKIVG